MNYLLQQCILIKIVFNTRETGMSQVFYPFLCLLIIQLFINSSVND